MGGWGGGSFSEPREAAATRGSGSGVDSTALPTARMISQLRFRSPSSAWRRFSNSSTSIDPSAKRRSRISCAPPLDVPPVLRLIRNQANAAARAATSATKNPTTSTANQRSLCGPLTSILRSTAGLGPNSQGPCTREPSDLPRFWLPAQFLPPVPLVVEAMQPPTRCYLPVALRPRQRQKKAPPRLPQQFPRQPTCEPLASKSFASFSSRGSAWLPGALAGFPLIRSHAYHVRNPVMQALCETELP